MVTIKVLFQAAKKSESDYSDDDEPLVKNKEKKTPAKVQYHNFIVCILKHEYYEFFNCYQDS